MKVTDPDDGGDGAQGNEGADEDEDNKGQKFDGRRRRSVVTIEQKQAFGRKNETLNQRKVRCKIPCCGDLPCGEDVVEADMGVASG